MLSTAFATARKPHCRKTGGSGLKKVAIITDSVACLTPELAQKHEILIVPLYILSNGKTYRDGIDLSTTEAYELFLQNPDNFSTSAPSPAEYVNAYREASKKAEGVLCITLSSKLSSTYEAAVIGKENAAREIPGIRIEILDSLTATSAEGFVALAAARAAEDGASLEEVIRAAEAVKNRVNVYVLLDTVRHVYRSGRVPKLAAQAGSLLNIRALFKVSGKVHLTGVVRSRERGIEMMFEKIRAKVNGAPVHASVLHAYAPESVKPLMERMKREFNCVELWQSEFSPLMGYACGTGTLAVAFYPEITDAQS